MAWPWNGEEDRPTATQVGKSREFHYDHLYIFCLRRASALDEWLRKKVEKEKNPIFLVVEKGEKQELVGILKRLHPKGLRYIVTINIEKEERNWKPFAEQLQKEFREPEKLTFGGELFTTKEGHGGFCWDVFQAVAEEWKDDFPGWIDKRLTFSPTTDP
jgi:hypothetical protein